MSTAAFNRNIALTDDFDPTDVGWWQYFDLDVDTDNPADFSILEIDAPNGFTFVYGDFTGHFTIPRVTGPIDEIEFWTRQGPNPDELLVTLEDMEIDIGPFVFIYDISGDNPNEAQSDEIFQIITEGLDTMLLSDLDDEMDEFWLNDGISYTIIARGGDDTIDSTNGADFISGGAGDDELNGGGGFDTLLGNSGEDTIRGQGGDDSIDGGSADDLLLGGSGDDFIAAGAGQDIVQGQGGADTFFFETGDSTGNIIIGFDDDEDVFEIGAGASSFEDLTLTDIAGDVLVEFSNVDFLVQDITTADLDSGDFII
ncbi:MAG: calcium-binding protein [Pseudomonadota bacterium]